MYNPTPFEHRAHDSPHPFAMVGLQRKSRRLKIQMIYLREIA
jgi:hypothetical protein